jgi:mannosyltransferase
MLFFDGIVFSLQRYGGISVYFNALMNGVHEREFDFSVGLYGTDLIGRPSEQVRSHWRSLPSRPFERYRDFSSSYKLCHSSYYRVSNSSLSKRVVTVYDFTYERYFPFLKKIAHSAQKNRAIRAADVVLCISDSTRRDLFHFLPDVDRRKVLVTHLGANDIFFSDLQATVRTQTEGIDGYDIDSGYILFVGARTGYKNFSPLVHALHEKHLHLVCVGGGALTESELRLCEKWIPGKFHHLAWIDDEGLRQLYRNAIALVFPSVYEGFGIPIVEAMASGCPVIASNVSSVPEVAGTGAVLLDEVTSGTLALAIQCVQDPSRRAELIAHGKEQAELFTWKRCIDSTLSAYADLI